MRITEIEFQLDYAAAAIAECDALVTGANAREDFLFAEKLRRAANSLRHKREALISIIEDARENRGDWLAALEGLAE